MFLQPQHLQVLQRQVNGRLASERALAREYPYGVISGEPVATEVGAGVVRFKALRAVLPGSGLVVDVPGNTDELALPVADIVAERPHGATILLAVPMTESGVPLVADERIVPSDQAVRCVYRVESAQQADENRPGGDPPGSDPPMLRFRRVNARLIDEKADRRRLDCLPVARVRRGVGQRPELDPLFVPPILVMSASPRLRSMVERLAGDIEVARGEAARHLAPPGSTGVWRWENVRGTQVEPLLRLQALSRAAAALRHVLAPEHAAPSDVFAVLSTTLADLMALYPDRTPQMHGYTHADPLSCFDGVCKSIEPVLRRVAISVDVIEFTRAPGHMVATVKGEVWKRPVIYLGVKAEGMQTSDLATIVTDGRVFKVMPASKWNEDWPGITVVREDAPPAELRPEPHLHYFRLEPGGETTPSRARWNEAKAEQAVGIRWPQFDSRPWQVALYLPRSSEVLA